MGADDDAPAISAGAGWVKGDQSGDATGNDRQITIAYKKVTDYTLETAGYTWTLGAADNAVWWIGSLSGIDLTAPEDEPFSGNSGLNQNAVSPTCSSISVLNTGAFVLAGWASNAPAGTEFPPTTWTALVTKITKGAVCLNVGCLTITSVGAIGVTTLNSAGSTAETQAGQWAFKPITATVTGNITGFMTTNAKFWY
jgi:hypothetical protein